MTTEIKDQSKRIKEIALLEAIVEKNFAAIRVQRLTLQRQEEKQINRLAELRVQKMLLAWNLAAAVKASTNPPIQ